MVYWRIIVPLLVKNKGVCCGALVKFDGMPIISKVSDSKIEIGDKTVVCSNSEFTALGVNHPTILRTLRKNAFIKIGMDCGISGLTVCAAISVEIGNQCLLGANVTIADTDFHPIRSKNRRYSSKDADISAKPVTIGDNVFIGAGSYILKGVKIGNNSVIGAMSVVTSDVPSNVIFAGNPAEFIKNI